MAVQPPPQRTDPFLPGPYGQDFLPRLGISGDLANQMGLDPSRGAELAAMLMNAQFGQGAPMSGRFGDYMRQQAGNIGTMRDLFDILNIGGGSAERGGGYRTFEDMFESLGAGRGTPHPGEADISDWRNLIYGGKGAARGGGLLGGGERVAAIPQGDLGAATNLVNQLRPLLTSTMSSGAWGMLQNLLPDLFTRFNKETSGGTSGPMWLQWLRQGGYLPSQAL